MGHNLDLIWMRLHKIPSLRLRASQYDSEERYPYSLLLLSFLWLATAPTGPDTLKMYVYHITGEIRFTRRFYSYGGSCAPWAGHYLHWPGPSACSAEKCRRVSRADSST